MYKIDQGHLTIVCIVFCLTRSPVRIIAQVQWFVYQNWLEPSGGIYHLYKCNWLLWLQVNSWLLSCLKDSSWVRQSCAAQNKYVRSRLCSLRNCTTYVDFITCTRTVAITMRTNLLNWCQNVVFTSFWW